jgi:hypothetical protein
MEYTATVRVTNLPPSITAVANPGPALAGSPVTIAVTASDPAGTFDPLQYELDCDNNGTYEVGPQASNSAGCTFPSAGSARVNVRVTDGDGGSATSFTTVTVNSSSQTATYYLHGTGANANPVTLFVSTTAPTSATEKYKDSPAVNFAGGNPWQEIGTWASTPPPSAGTLTSLGDLHAWLGLKNSDDQGTQFDLRAEVYRNGVLVASSQTLCITGVTRNEAQAKEATTAFGGFSPVSFNGSSDRLAIKVLTRIGTNPDGSKCVGPGGSHNNAIGLRLYFDATDRQSRFGVTATP